MTAATLAIALLLGRLPAGTEGSAPTAATSPPAAQTAPATGCALKTLAPDAALAADCASCHGSGHTSAKSHPVGVDYASAQAASKGGLATLDAVTHAGVRVPDGKVQCVTCHDPSSPWADHLALPQGAVPKAAAVPGVPETYESTPEGSPAPGSRVSPKPLCLACHAF